MNRRRIRTILVGLITFGVGWFSGVVWTSFQAGYSELMRRQADDLQAARAAENEPEKPGFVPLKFDPARGERLRSRLN